MQKNTWREKVRDRRKKLGKFIFFSPNIIGIIQSIKIK
jgi:hypothetical protein